MQRQHKGRAMARFSVCLLTALAAFALSAQGLRAQDSMPDPRPRMEHLNPPYLDLAIDSDNNNGTDDPDRSDEENRLREVPPGKIILTNVVDSDGDGIPDYADDQLASDANLVPVILEASAGQAYSLSEVEFTFVYPGAPTLPQPPYPGLDLGDGVFDYTGARVGLLRLWRLDSPGHPRMAVNPEGEPIYIVPGQRYTAYQLRMFGPTKRFWLEAVNPTTGDLPQMVQVTMSALGNLLQALPTGQPNRQVGAQPEEAMIGVNCSNAERALPPGQRRMRPAVPDVAFNIDNFDHDIQVQPQTALRWWFSGDLGAACSDMSLTDLCPLRVVIPNDFVLSSPVSRYWLEVIGGGVDWDTMYIYRAASPANNRRQFLQPPTIQFPNLAAQQLANTDPPPRGTATVVQIRNTTPPNRAIGEITAFTLDRAAGASVTTELVIKVTPNPGVATPAADIRVVLWAQPRGQGRAIPASSLRLSFRLARNLFATYSARGNPGGAFAYDIEEDQFGATRTINIPVYPNPVLVNGAIDPAKRQLLVAIHGYRTSLDQAYENFSQVYRRVFWLGFRGNYVLFTWRGDQGAVGDWLTQLAYDANVRNAFQTAPAFMNFLTTCRQIAGNDSRNVNLMAHSLGGLVMWDGLRLRNRADGPPANAQKWAQNVINVEIAIWREAFEPSAQLVYPTPPRYRSAGAQHNVTYTVDELRRTSWRFYFNQANRPPTLPINGAVYHSYNPGDFALAGGNWPGTSTPWAGAMRHNDDAFRRIAVDWFLVPPPLPSLPLPLPCRRWIHYFRGRSDLTAWTAAFPADPLPGAVSYRVPIAGPGNENSLSHRIPALMEVRDSNYNAFLLNVPAGAAAIDPSVAPNSLNATTVGWGADRHSDLYEAAFHTVWNWYAHCLTGRTSGLGQNPPFNAADAIPIGQE